MAKSFPQAKIDPIDIDLSSINMTELVKIIEPNFLFLIEYNYSHSIESMETYRYSHDRTALASILSHIILLGQIWLEC